MKDKIINSLKNEKGFMHNNGFKIIELTKEKCVLEYKIIESGLNPYGIVHGGLLFGLADSACGILSTMNEKKCVTTSANINYLNAAKGEKIIATATIIKDGKNIGYYKCDMEDENNKLLATATINLYYLNY